MLKIVPISDIPLAELTPIDNLMQVYAVCQKLEVLCKKENGVGISAVQAGIPWNLFLIKTKNGFDYYVNCDYTPFSDEKLTYLEGCLSIRDCDNNLRYFNVVRFSKVLINGFKLLIQDKDLVLESIENQLFDDFYSIVMQHEIDHSKNILISEIGEEVEIYHQV